MTVLQWAGAVLMVLGGLVCLSAAVGMVLLPDVAARLQAATKAQISGVLLTVVGAAPFLTALRALALLALVALFQMFTAPVLAQIVARAAYRAGSWRSDRLVVDELAEATRDEDR